MKVKIALKAVGSFFVFVAGKVTSFARLTVAVFRPAHKADAFAAYYGKGGTFDTQNPSEREENRNQNAFRTRRRVLAMLLLMAAMLLCAATLWLGSLWKITEVRVEGCVNYVPHAVIEVSGIREGGEYLGADTWTVARRIRKALPLAKNIKVVKHLDGTVVITVTEYPSLYYTQFHENYYAIDPDGMRILEVSSRGDVYRSMGATYIGLPEDARVRVGETLTYAYAPYLTDDETEEAFTYEVEHEDPVVEYAYVSDVIEEIMAWELADRVTGMELSDRYGMYLVVDGRIKVQFGKKTDLAAKLALAGKILTQPIEGELAAILDVSDGVTASFREDATLILPSWAKS